jgi:two-component system chemotaxis response regulator CheY
MKKTVLIIDDFENSLFATGFSIQQAGYDILKAKSGKEALAILKSNPSVNLIVSDYNMPEMNGLQLVTQIKNNPDYQNIPIFILSTETKEEVRNKVMQAGASIWIKKPFQPVKLIEYIKRAIG